MDQPTHSTNQYHVPVMESEVTSWLEPASHGWIVDCTYGGGGHTRALLERYQRVRIIGIDRDHDAITHARHDARLTLVEANFADLESVLGNESLPETVDGILCDFGVSSHQLDSDDRGFSYHRNGPLDMRMGSDAPRSAADIVNEYTEGDLTQIFREFGEERFARRIAQAIVAERPFSETVALADCVANAVPAAARRNRHPARRVFQALRIAVNDELTSIVKFMDSVFDRLAPGGRLVVMAYHSLEDRIIKHAYIDHATSCVCPPGLPECVCDTTPDFRILTPKAVRPTQHEIERNPRSRSARLRVGERI